MFSLVRKTLGLLGIQPRDKQIVEDFQKPQLMEVAPKDSEGDDEDECIMCGRKGEGKVCGYCISNYFR